MKNIFRVLAIFILGGLGGVIFERTLVPWLLNHTPLANVETLRLDHVTVVQPKEEIIIDRLQATQKAVEKVQSSVVAVERYDARGRILGASSGAFLTGDGIVVADAAPLSGGGSFRIRRDRDSLSAELLGLDSTHAIALLRVSGSGFPVLSFAGAHEAMLGTPLFLLHAENVSDASAGSALALKLAEGFLASQDSKRSALSFPSEGTGGGAVFTLEGKLFGLLVQDGQAFASIDDLQAALQSSMGTKNSPK